MNRLVAAAAALLLALPALAAPSQGKPALSAAGKDAAAQPVRGKAQAPVSITAQLRSGGATVTVRFHSAATDVGIEAHGLDGLAVTSAGTLLSGGRFAGGESVRFDVAFTEGPGRSQLVVSVSGRFGPVKRSAIAAFPMGQPSAAQQNAAGGAVRDSTGERIKLLPAETR